MDSIYAINQTVSDMEKNGRLDAKERKVLESPEIQQMLEAKSEANDVLCPDTNQLFALALLIAS